MNEPLTFTLPKDLVERIATRVAELLTGNDKQATEVSPWLDLNGACACLGLSRDALYKLTAAKAIPVRKKRNGQGLLFHRDELDTWIRDQYPRLDRLG